MRAQITLKSGAQIEADMTSLDTERNREADEFISLKWVTPKGWTAKLHGVLLSEIAAIVVLRDVEGPPGGDPS